MRSGVHAELEVGTGPYCSGLSEMRECMLPIDARSGARPVLTTSTRKTRFESTIRKHA
jgi:hypothetical protein